MVDEKLLDWLVGKAELKAEDRVLEVGAGTGNLTEEIAKKARVWAVEKDRDLCARLRRRFKGNPNVTVVEADALRVELPGRDKVVSNIPYSISRELTERLILGGLGVAVLVTQREFAEKLLGKPGGDNYRMLSVLAQTTCDIEPLGRIPGEAFDPKPKVESAAVKLVQKWVPPKEYIPFLNRLFSGKNKKIRNIMDVPEGYRQMRPGEMTPQELRELFHLAKD